MSDNGSFRSSIMGFNREDVVSYISGIMEKTAANESRVTELQGKLDAKTKEFDALSAEYASLKARYDELAKRSIDCGDKCTQCDINRQNEAKLGAAMMDAKRFSEILVSEANEKARNIYAKALEEVTASKNEAERLSEQADSVLKVMEEAFSLLAANLTALINSMGTFSDEAAQKAKGFEYRSEFSEETMEIVISREPTKTAGGN